jgi:hypothetical protein
MLQYILDNRQWIFSGIGVALASGIVALVFRQRRRGTKQIQRSGANCINIQGAGDLSFGASSHIGRSREPDAEER